MPQRTCNACQTPLSGKPVSLYWAWFTVAEERVSYLQKVCVGCFAQSVLPWQVAGEVPTYTCPNCHADTTDDNDMTFVTIYVPGFPELRCDWATCGPCAARVRVFGQTGAKRLADRGTGVGGLGPPTSAPRLSWDEYKATLA